MISPPFIHLHVHTAYSLLEGAIKVEHLVEKTVQDGLPAVAMTDKGNVFGAMALAHSATDSGIQPILGCELLIRLDDPTRKFGEPQFKKLVVLVKNEEGYTSIRHLFRTYYMGPGKEEVPHLTLDEFISQPQGLIVLTGGPDGLINTCLLNKWDEQAKSILKTLQTAFPNRLYIELQRHGTEEEIKTEPLLLQLALDFNLPIVATNEPFFEDAAMYEAHDAYLCIADKTYVVEQNRRRVTPEHYLKTATQMTELFSDLPEALENTVKIAQQCYFMATKKKPAFPIFDCGEYTEDDLLDKNAHEGLKLRVGHLPPEEQKVYFDRLEYELGIIKKMGFSGYFLIVADFINWSKNNGVPVGPGRGSGAGSVVAWSIKITGINPLRFHLLFERFLNPERVSMPDFDVDFCQENREKTIEYVQKKYGFDHVAQIITFGKLQAKAVIRDVGRVLQVPHPVVDRLAKLVPNTLNITLKEALEVEPELQKQADADEMIAHLLKIALQLEGLYRNTSTHAAGVVIGDKPLEEIIPIYKDPSSDMPVTQYNMKYVEDASLIKFDFLGLKTLTTIAKTMGLLGDKGNFNIQDLPLDDPETYKLFKAATTVGVFQLESAGMRQILRDMQPDTIEDIIALISLFRPGPMDNIPTYIARKKGLEEPDYMHPMLESILKETYGIMVYQEQVMQISQKMAGYTLGGADLLRRAMGKKKKEEMAKQRDIFIEGAKKNGVTKETAETVFDKMAKFAEYGFNKSHAAAYAYISYQTAYLKAHYPAEFMAATMTLDKTNTDKLAVFKADITKFGVEVVSPDINLSEVDFSVKDGKIIYALSAIKNVGEAGMAQIVEERKKNGPFKSLQDLFSRVDASAFNRRYLEQMIKAGVFDSLHNNRAQLFNNIDKMLAYATGTTEQRNSSQISLFGEQTLAELKLDPAASWPMLEQLEYEKEAFGFYLSHHPLDMYEGVFERLRIVPSTDIESMVQNVGAICVNVAGIVAGFRERLNQKGKKFAFVSLADKSGLLDVGCFAESYELYKDLLKSGKPVLLTITADYNKEGNAIRSSVQKVEYLEDAVSKTHSVLLIHLNQSQALPEIKKVLSTLAPGNNGVYFLLETPLAEVEIGLKEKYAIHTDTIEILKRIPGISEIQAV